MPEMMQTDVTDRKPADRKIALISDIKALIIEAVGLHHLKPETLDAAAPLTRGGLNLDSVDILEIVVCVEKKYQVKVDSAEAGQKHFATIDGIADFVLQKSLKEQA
jgi:acyl carrier protein